MMPGKWVRPSYLPPETTIGSPEIVRQVIPIVRRHGAVVQAGGHVGVWPAALAQSFQRVLSFEPVQYLWKTCMDAIQAKNVLMMPCALSAVTGSVKISVAPDKVSRFSGSSAVAETGVPVPCVALDEIPAFLTHELGAIMLDIEGHELEALTGARRTIAMWKPVVTVEQNAKSLRHRSATAVAELLAPFGYRQAGSCGADLIFAVKS